MALRNFSFVVCGLEARVPYHTVRCTVLLNLVSSIINYYQYPDTGMCLPRHARVQVQVPADICEKGYWKGTRVAVYTGDCV